jgi:polyferredoxin
MSTAQEPHPIISHIEIIEQRLGRIENALGIDQKPKPVLRKRTMILVSVLLIFGIGFFLALRMVFNRLFDALPV